ncbi:putative extracellular dihydrogeodin oxidase [Rhypophila decipiens]|uniref:Extracellular dihydrogeodin oxidase n=1 Tax=Rhypophila decipiens TaxID=261697 RepID=A0AAN7B393_9PEZI|nr:putative extracellular dihydrogeodin oxidase [Rhypophila decipiens]
MKLSLFSVFAALAVGADALSVPSTFTSNLRPRLDTSLEPRQAKVPMPCGEHGPKNRKCWKNDYSVETDYYDVAKIPKGRRNEKWLSVRQGECSPDGFKRPCMTMNGTIPGPTIEADWGDELIIHVTNDMSHDIHLGNGTAIHWHGLRMLNNMANDGVPGVTSCPIAPGETFTYRFHVTQYGSTWYHSHFSLQYGDGLYGGMIFHGPATDDYDEDLGIMTLADWGHLTAFQAWRNGGINGRAPRLTSTLINGTNTFRCNNAADCGGVPEIGKKFEMTIEPKKTYRLRLVNAAVDGVFQFSIDGHKFKVIANDLVPVVPFETDSIKVQMGQRYDIIIEAKDDANENGNYWIRGGWVGAGGCAAITNGDDATGILRYKGSDGKPPTTTSTVVPATDCRDEINNSTRLAPYLAQDVQHFNLDTITIKNLSSQQIDPPADGSLGNAKLFQWTLHGSSLYLNWSDPALGYVVDQKTTFPSPYNVANVKPSGPDPEWAILVVQQASTAPPLDHPFHLHGHDFWVLAAEVGVFDVKTAKFNTKNPMRRDVATLPARGYLAIAFLLDNPGVWLAHCHIAWHASQGLSMQFVESRDQIKIADEDLQQYDKTCKSWRASGPWHQDDSGI